ncbi:NAD-dependent epimerase/dehydratase family protein [Amycolatopsis pigmentata]|uniref:NAD-dependent epimerase/dehydratase family protein n=1 Tax=Amycolatopsis pigmentata TaxID=450801 RepID=A0ABW5FX75_9PSEU
MKVVVTGGAGFVGANLCRELLSRRDYEVVVLDNLSTGKLSNLDGLDVEFRKGSVLDPVAVAATCAGAESIVHLAAVPAVLRSIENPRRSHETNVTGTMTVLEAARESGAHVIVASSSSVYGRNPTLPKTPDLVCLPSSPYAVSKLAAESYALAYQSSFGLECCVFRFFNIFGPLQAPNHAYAAVIPSFVFNALHGLPLTIYGDGEQSRDFTFIGSVVEILAEAVASRMSGIRPVNLAFGTRTTVNEIVAVLSDLLGRPLDVRYRPPRPGDVRHSQAEPGVLTKLFPRVHPVPLAHGLVRTISWLESLAEPQAKEVPA